MAAKRDSGKLTKTRYPGVYKRNGGYVATVYRGGKKDWKGGFDTAEEARDWKAEEERTKRRRGRKQSYTVAEWRDRWLNDFHGPNTARKRETTRAHNEERTKPFAEEFGDRPLADISKDEAAAWSVENFGRVPATQAMFSDAYEIGLIDSNPFAGKGIKRPSQTGRKNIAVIDKTMPDPKDPSKEISELDLLVRCAAEEHGKYGETYYKAFILVGAGTGMRPGEIYAMAWRHIDWKNSRVWVRFAYNSKTGKREDLTKSGLDRHVILPAFAREALAALPEGDPDDIVFVTKQGSRYTGRTHHYYWDPVRRAFERSLPEGRRKDLFWDSEKGEFRNMDFYELRHYCATYLLTGAFGKVEPLFPHEVAVQLGHNDNGKLVMSTYAHVAKEPTLRKIARTFDDAAVSGL